MDEEKYNSIVKPVGLIGDTWSLLIIHTLLEEPKRFNELKNQIPSISNRTLSAKLKHLSLQGVLERQVLEGNPPNVQYYLTPLGKGIKPILVAIEDFGDKFFCD